MEKLTLLILATCIVCTLARYEVNLLNAMEVDDNVAGVQSIDGRYRAYQFYTNADEIKASDEVRDELIRDFIRDKEFVFVANVRHDKSTPSTLFSMMTTKGKIKFSIWIDSVSKKLGIKMHNRNSESSDLRDSSDLVELKLILD